METNLTIHIKKLFNFHLNVLNNMNHCYKCVGILK